MPLTQEEIDKLLAPKIRSLKPSKLVERYPGAKNLGPLRFRDSTERCASRGCSTTTSITISGIHYCAVHALQQLNVIILSRLYPGIVVKCTCECGQKYSNFSKHTPDCALYEHIENGVLKDV